MHQTKNTSRPVVSEASWGQVPTCNRIETGSINCCGWRKYNSLLHFCSGTDAGACCGAHM